MSKLIKFTNSCVSSVLSPSNSTVLHKMKSIFKFITINKALFNYSIFLLVLAAIYLTLLVMIKIFAKSIHIGNNCKVSIIEFYYEKLLFHHKFPYCTTRSRISFTFFGASNLAHLYAV